MTDLKTLPVWISHGTLGKHVTQLRQNHPFRATDRKWNAQVCLPWPQKRQSQMSAICRWSSGTSVWTPPLIYQPACWSMQPQTGITKIKKPDQNFNFQFHDCTLEHPVLNIWHLFLRIFSFINTCVTWGTISLFPVLIILKRIYIKMCIIHKFTHKSWLGMKHGESN